MLSTYGYKPFSQRLQFFRRQHIVLAFQVNTFIVCRRNLLTIRRAAVLSSLTTFLPSMAMEWTGHVRKMYCSVWIWRRYENRKYVHVWKYKLAGDLRMLFLPFSGFAGLDFYLRASKSGHLTEYWTLTYLIIELAILALKNLSCSCILFHCTDLCTEIFSFSITHSMGEI